MKYTTYYGESMLLGSFTTQSHYYFRRVDQENLDDSNSNLNSSKYLLKTYDLKDIETWISNLTENLVLYKDGFDYHKDSKYFFKVIRIFAKHFLPVFF